MGKIRSRGLAIVMQGALDCRAACSVYHNRQASRSYFSHIRNLRISKINIGSYGSMKLLVDVNQGNFLQKNELAAMERLHM